MPASFTATDVPQLIAAIDAANLTTEADTITLAAGKTFTLTQANYSAHGSTGLPAIAGGEDLTIFGNGATIERSTHKGTTGFRLFDVAAGASLTLQNLTLQRGLAFGAGGAIVSEGALALSGVTVQYNTAQGGVGGSAFGGGIYSAGSLTIEHSIIRNNQALGGAGWIYGSSGGSAAGGGIYVAGGSAGLVDVTLYSNTARGGDGANGEKQYSWEDVKRTQWYSGATPGGDGLGGALYAGGGTVSLLQSTVTNNSAIGGSGGSNGNSKTSDGAGQGGGLYLLAPAVSVCLDLFTQANVKNNSPDEIFGSYVLC